MHPDARKRVSAPAEFRGIQALRGLAACMVALFHSTQIWSEHTWRSLNSIAWLNGAAGVDIFFVISGFVMTVSSVGKQSAHPGKDFLERRLIRIAPLYWIVTSVVLVQLLLHMHPVFEPGGKYAATTLGYVVSSYLFIPYRNSLGVINPLLVVGWTLTFEMFFYLLFAAALGLRINVVRFLTPLMVVLAVVGMFRQRSWPAITVLASPLLLEFLAGVLLGYAVVRGFEMRWELAAGLGVVGLAAIAVVRAPETYTMRVVVWGLPAVLIVLSAAMLEDRFGGLVPRWAQLLGDASYSLYLFHLLILSAVGVLLVRMHVLTMGVVHRRDEVVTVLACMSAGIFASLLLYWWVENPLNKALRRRLRVRQEMRAARALELVREA